MWNPSQFTDTWGQSSKKAAPEKRIYETKYSELKRRVKATLTLAAQKVAKPLSDDVNHGIKTKKWQHELTPRTRRPGRRVWTRCDAASRRTTSRRSRWAAADPCSWPGRTTLCIYNTRFSWKFAQQLKMQCCSMSSPQLGQCGRSQGWSCKLSCVHANVHAKSSRSRENTPRSSRFSRGYLTPKQNSGPLSDGTKSLPPVRFSWSECPRTPPSSLLTNVKGTIRSRTYFSVLKSLLQCDQGSTRSKDMTM